MKNCYILVDGVRNEIDYLYFALDESQGKFIPNEALADGEHTYKVVAKDRDGNSSEKSVTFRVLTTYPSLTVSTPASDETILNTPNITVAGSTNTGTGNIVSITVNDEDQGAITLDSSGNFSKSITLPEDGTYTIIVKSKNSANLITTVSRTIILDTTEPVFKSVEINPNPVNTGNTYVIRVKVE